MWFRTDTVDIQGQVLAHAKKSTLIESMNKCGCEGISKSHCQQLPKNRLGPSKGYVNILNMIEMETKMS